MKLFFLFLIITLLFLAQGIQTCSGVEASSSPELGVEERQRNLVDSYAERDIIMGEVIVRFIESADIETIEKIVASINAEIIKTVSKKRKTYLVRLPEALAVQDAVNTLNKKREVVYAEPNLKYEVMGE